MAMMYRRRYRRRQPIRKARGRRRVLRRRYGRRIKRRESYMRVKRRVYVGSAQTSNTTTANFMCYVTPSLSGASFSVFGNAMLGLNNLSEYQSLFDEYKVNAYKLELRPRAVNFQYGQNETDAGASLKQQPFLTYAVDRRGTSDVSSGTYGATSYNSFCEVGNMKTRRADKPIFIYVKAPNVTEQFGGGATRWVRAPWTNTTSSGIGVPLQGVYMYSHTNQFLITSMPFFDVYITWYLSFKGKR